MRCPVQDGHPELLLDFCARTLPADTAAILEHHMNRCPECRQMAESQEAVWSALDSWTAPRVSDDFDDMLYQRIADSPKRSFWPLLHVPPLSWKPALTIALAGGAMAMALLIPAAPDRPTASLNQESSAGEPLEAEQVERTVEDLDMLRQFSTPARQPRI
jgi:hypothetical protein